jgi:hypothetical protein
MAKNKLFAFIIVTFIVSCCKFRNLLGLVKGFSPKRCGEIPIFSQKHETFALFATFLNLKDGKEPFL